MTSASSQLIELLCPLCDGKGHLDNEDQVERHASVTRLGLCLDVVPSSNSEPSIVSHHPTIRSLRMHADSLFNELEELSVKHQLERTQSFEAWLRRQDPSFAWIRPETHEQPCPQSASGMTSFIPGEERHTPGGNLVADISNKSADLSVVSRMKLPRAGALAHSLKQAVQQKEPHEQPASLKRKPTSLQSLAKKKPKKPQRRKSGFILAPTAVIDETSQLQKFTSSRAYEMSSSFLIALNSVCIGWQVQWSSEHARDNAMNYISEKTDSIFFDVLSASFTLAFTLELGLRWVAEGLLGFFQTDEFGWCIFDVVVVGVGLIEFLFSTVFTNSKIPLASEISLLRVLRVMRIVKVLRVIRVMRFFRELRMMIWSIMGSLKSLLWVMLVLGLLFYMFGILVTQGVNGYLSDEDAWHDPGHKDLIESFATLDQSILSLYMSMSGGNDWSLYYQALSPLPIQYRALFLVFITFSVFAVVNIVTGVFVQSALESSNQDREILVHEELESQKQYYQAMRQFFEEIDEDGTGSIGYEEFEGKLGDERVVAYFNALKLDISNADMIFNLLDYDQSGEISIEEFLDGCYKLQGESRALDMKVMQFEVKWLRESLVEFMAAIGGLAELDTSANRGITDPVDLHGDS